MEAGKEPSLLPWDQPEFLDEAGAWVRSSLESLGTKITGSIEQPHLRPWSTVLRFPTDQGFVFFKACSPVLSHEPLLTQALASWRADCMAPVLAVDPARAWMLMPDYGKMLREVIERPEDIQRWDRILEIYAGVQIEMAPRLSELLALEIIDRRLEVLPRLYQDLLEDETALLIGQPDGLSPEDYRQALALVPRFDEQCSQLASYGIPESLHHDDFHDGNIFLRNGQYLFSDWAESCAAHPFFSLVVGLRGIAHRFELPQDDPALARIREGYLRAWGDYASPPRLRQALELALKVGALVRTLTWYRVVSSLPEPFHSQYAEAVPGWLQEFLEREAAPDGEE